MDKSRLITDYLFTLKGIYKFNKTAGRVKGAGTADDQDNLIPTPYTC